MHVHRLNICQIAPESTKALQGIEQGFGPLRRTRAAALRAVRFGANRRPSRRASAWSGALTLIHRRAGARHPYGELRRHFSENEIVDTTTLIGMINLWNRLLAIAVRYEHPMSR